MLRTLSRRIKWNNIAVNGEAKFGGMEGWQWFRVWCDRRLTTKKQKEGEDAAQPILIGNEKVKKEEGET